MAFFVLNIPVKVNGFLNIIYVPLHVKVNHFDVFCGVYCFSVELSALLWKGDSFYRSYIGYFVFFLIVLFFGLVRFFIGSEFVS